MDGMSEVDVRLILDVVEIGRYGETGLEIGSDVNQIDANSSSEMPNTAKNSDSKAIFILAE